MKKLNLMSNWATFLTSLKLVTFFKSGNLSRDFRIGEIETFRLFGFRSREKERTELPVKDLLEPDTECRGEILSPRPFPIVLANRSRPLGDEFKAS